MRVEPKQAGTFSLFVILALAIRLVYLFQLSASPIGSLAILDSQVYQNRALAILDGQVLPTEVFRMSPLYPYLLAGAYRAAGAETLNFARLWQALLGALGCGLTFLLGKRLAGYRAGIAAGVLYLLFGYLVFADGLILAESSLCFFHLCFLLALLSAIERRSWPAALFSGLLLGLCAALRGNVLIYVLPIILFLLWRPRADRKPMFLRVAAPLLLGLSAPVALAAAANYHAERDLVLLSSNAGFNYYIGNHPKASGTFDKIAGHDEVRGFDPLKDLDGRDFARAIAGRRLSPSEASRFWVRAAFDGAKGRCAAFVGLQARKLLLFFGGEQLPQIYSYDLTRGEVPILKLLPITFAVLIPLGLLGLAQSLVRGGVHRLLAILCLCYGLSISLFFVASRYRVPIIPLVAVFAGCALVGLVETVQRRRWAQVGKSAAALAAFSVLPLLPLQPHDPCKVLLHFANVYDSSGKREAARVVAEKAVRQCPDDARALFLMAQIAHSEGDFKEALDYYRRAALARDVKPEYLFRLASLQSQLRMQEQALRSVATGLEMAPGNVEGLLLLGQIQERRGDLRDAMATLQKAVDLKPDSVSALYHLGRLAALAGEPELARSSLQEAARLAPEAQEIRDLLRRIENTAVGSDQGERPRVLR